MSKSADSHLEQSAFSAFADNFNKAIEGIDWSIVPPAKDNTSAQAVLPELTLTKDDVEYNPSRPWERQVTKELHEGPTDKVEKINWVTNTADGYDAAVQAKKPIVMVFGENGQWSQAMNKELDKDEFQRLSNQAVFLKSTPSTDLVAANIGKALGVDHYPSISVLSPNGSMLDEVGRIVGYFDAATVASKVGEYIAKVNAGLQATGAQVASSATAEKSVAA
ncbi:MAG: hypothetical protein JST89_02145 [Cyanobacteria bacterium SZAS-4]|nr:hypothetical protein [Cyanobacteria bacterium SZAS-4]